MNYEKKYKEALEKARQFSEHPLEEDSSSIVEYIFPELKESEDEKIRKYLLKLADRCPEDSIDFMRGVKKGDILAWLEKQGTSYTKRDVDDAFVEGMAFAKDELEKQCEKPAWSEEDDGYKLVALSAFLNYYDEENPLRKCLINWLKSIRQRIGE